MKTIVFDLGGVLIDWNPRYLYTKIFAAEEEMEWFLSHVCSPSWNARQDAGRSFAEGILEAKAKYPKYAPQIELYFSRWDEMLGGPVAGTPEILREVKERHHKVYALTNWSAETFPLAQAKFNFLGEFDGILVSGREKLAKPDPAIFTRFLQRFNLTAPDCVFIDDNVDNVAAAAQQGFETVLFKDAPSLRRELVERGVL